MIRRISALACALALLMAPLAWAEPVMSKVSATQAVSTVTFVQNTRGVTIINDGANTVWYRLFTNTETAAAATAAVPSVELKSGEAHEHPFQELSTDQGGGPGGYFKTLSLICDTGETATVRVISK